jgi:hypothetical protein
MSHARSLAACACLALVALLTPAMARDLDARPACELTYEKAVEIGHGVVAQNPDATFTEYSGKEAKKLVDAMNAFPPESSWTADRVVVIGAGDDLPFRVGLVENGCVTRAFPVPHIVWSGILSAALGDRS